jgi:putative ABC transport system permease protein
VASREARRSKGRTALILAMLTLPVLGLAFAAVSYDMFQLKPAENVVRQLGAADATVTWVVDGPVHQDPSGTGFSSSGPVTGTPKTTAQVLHVLPAGSHAITYVRSTVSVRTAHGIGDIGRVELDTGDPMTRGLVTLLRGRMPAADNEVALTERATGRVGVGIGGTVHTTNGDPAVTVVGIVEFSAQLSETILFRPRSTSASSPQNADGVWLVTTPQPLTGSDIQRLNNQGILVQSREMILHPPAEAASPQVTGQTLSVGVVVVGLALLEVVLLAGPAFAVGARRRRRDLALVAANGGTPAHLRRIVLADGLVLGTAAAVLGILAGIALAFGGRPLIEVYLAQRRAGGYRMFPLALLTIAGLAALIGLLAALVPAFTAARQDLVAALSGQRGVTRSRRRWLVLGLAMCLLGAGTAILGAWRISANVVLAGLVLGELGLVLCTPTLVGLIARFGRFLPLAPRIALRDTARNRASAAPAISAVMAAVAGSVALAIYFGATNHRDMGTYVPSVPPGYVSIGAPDAAKDPAATDALPQKGMADAVRGALPAAQLVRINGAFCRADQPKTRSCGLDPQLPVSHKCPYIEKDRPLSAAEQKAAHRDRRCNNETTWSSGFTFGLVVDDGPAVAALTGASGDDTAAASAVLRAGGAVVTDSRYVENGRITFAITVFDEGTSSAEPATISIPGYALSTGIKRYGAIVSTGALARTGMTSRPVGLVAATSRIPTQAEEDALRAALRPLAGNLQVSVERGRQLPTNPTALILAIASGLITLGAAGIATGLAAAEGRAELATLGAVGASPRVRRALSLSQSGVISGLGSLLGAVAGRSTG